MALVWGKTVRYGAARRCLGVLGAGAALPACSRSGCRAVSGPDASRGVPPPRYAGKCGAEIYPIADPSLALLKKAWEKGLNSPVTTAVGRLFDGAASLLGLIEHASYEGQAGMYLENIAESETRGRHRRNRSASFPGVIRFIQGRTGNRSYPRC